MASMVLLAIFTMLSTFPGKMHIYTLCLKTCNYKDLRTKWLLQWKFRWQSVNGVNGVNDVPPAYKGVDFFYASETG